MAFTILCTACLQRMELPQLDAAQLVAAGRVLCTCVRCGVKLKLDAQNRVVPAEPRTSKIFAIPKQISRAVARRERRGSTRFRQRGLLGWFAGKRVTVTDDHVEVGLWLRSKVHHVIPIAHVKGVVLIQHVFLDPPGAMWGVYLFFEELTIALCAYSKLDDAIDLASAINIALLARKPAGDPYRGLLPAASE